MDDRGAPAAALLSFGVRLEMDQMKATTSLDETTERRQWCIERAIKLVGSEESVWEIPLLAAALIELVETGKYSGAGDVITPEPPAAPLQLSVVRSEPVVEAEDPPAEQVVEGDGSGEALPPITEGESPAPELLTADASKPPELTLREFQVLEAIDHTLANGGDFPSMRELADESEVPMGSLHAVLERLTSKGILKRKEEGMGWERVVATHGVGAA